MLVRKYIIALFFLLGLMSFKTQQSKPTKEFGAVKVSGNKILDYKGNPLQLRGISLSWSIWGGQKYYNTEVIDWLIDDFKINVIRLAMAIEPNGGYLQFPDKQKQFITDLTDHAIKRGIYVVIDWHDHHANINIKESKEFFVEMAKKYKGVPNVMYEIWNEPERESLETVKKYSEELIKEIRKYDSDNLIIVGSPHWDQDVDVISKSPIIGYKNIAYSFHFYASDKNHQEKLRNRADFAIKNGLPIIVTEWGVGESNGDGEFNRDKTAAWLKWMEDRQLSWINWNLTDKKETTAILMPRASVNGKWLEKDLTDAGKFIREQLRLLNK
jgi:endoglucanase